MSKLDKVYIGVGKEYEFDNGGKKITMMFFEEDLKKLNDNFVDGCVKIDINRRKEPSDKGMTHYSTLNTFKPNKPATEHPPASNEVSDTGDEPF